MSKQDNLTDFLTDVADAIREKKGTTEKINPQKFSEEIKSLGTERPSVERKDVNFYDYDGTRLYSYTWDEAMAMTELPPLPTAKGLICQEWNYTLEDIKAQNGKCDIGATYITDDGKTRFYLTIDNERAKDIWLYLSASVSGGIVVDWGDGTIETPTGTTLRLNHKYAEFGDYVVAIEVKSGTLVFLGSGQQCVMGQVLAPSIERIEALRKVAIGRSVNSVSYSAFFNCSSLRHIVIPNSVTSIGTYAFYLCSSLRHIVIPNSVTNSMSYAFFSCSSLQNIVIPNSVTSIGSYAFYLCSSLRHIVIPNSVTSIGSNSARGCSSLQSVFFSNGITNIEGQSFQSDVSCAYFDFHEHNAIPTLSASNAFTSINDLAKIIVPDDLYDEWIAATNWSTLASKIVKDTEYTRPI